MSFDTFSDYLYLLRLSDSFLCICIVYILKVSLTTKDIQPEISGTRTRYPKVTAMWIKLNY